jgi:hypothetical protein
MRFRTCVVGLVIAAIAACGKPAEQKGADQKAGEPKQAERQPEAQKQAADKAQRGADQMAQGFQQMAQGLQQLAQGAAANGQAAKPVDFDKLETVLPALSGWTRAEPEGHQMSMPFPLSNTEATYKKGQSEVKITITDSAFNSLAIAPLSMMTAAGYSEKTSSGYKRATTIGGAPAYEEWDNNSKRGNVGVIVGNRFMVEANGSGIDSIDTLKDAVSKIDTKKLAALK